MEYTLSLSGEQYRMLRAHLLPGDGKEAAAVALCGRRAGVHRHRLVMQKLWLIPHGSCERSDWGISWETDLLIDLLEEARRAKLSVVKFHSHPAGPAAFSEQDDRSDQELFPSIDSWVEAPVPHASVIMLGDGQMFGRTFNAVGGFTPLAMVNVVGDDAIFWLHADVTGQEASVSPLPDFTRRHAKAFGARTTALLRRLRVAVVGCSGTGSIVVEQLLRLGVGHRTLVDPDVMDDVNLNRILNSTIRDAAQRRLKVDVAGDAVCRAGLGTTVRLVPRNLCSREAALATADCDIVVGCMDSAEGRFMLNRIAAFYVQPYVDVGVTLEADDDGSINQVCGYVHYLQPGRSSLLSRGAITLDEVVAEGVRRQNPDHYRQLAGEGYIHNLREERPAVISVNTVFSGLAVNELLARLHPFRDEPNVRYAAVGFSLSQMAVYPESEPATPCQVFRRYVGLGDCEPVLNLPELSLPEATK